MAEFTTLIEGLAFTECPRWREGRLYFSDQHTHRVFDITLDGKLEVLAEVAGKPSGLGFLPDGSLLIVSMSDRRILRRGLDGRLETYADLSHLAPWHLNDMLVDPEGRAWVGNFGFDLHGGATATTTVLICVEPDRTAKVVAEGLGFPNGMVLTPDGKTLIVAESFLNRLSAFSVDGGLLGERRTWASFGALPTSTDVGEILAKVEVAPDGICLDAEGAVWVADAVHNRVLRVQEGGAILEEIKTGETGAFACMLGGEDGRTLFICAAPTFVEAEASAHHRSSILMTRVRAPHAGTP
jgi:sugar lactone lactonase YvrE